MTAMAIEMTGVRKAFRFFTLEDVSLHLEPGQIMGLVGPNGAGKSTTIRLLMGLLSPDAGHIRLAGHDMPRDQAAAKAHQKSGGGRPVRLRQLECFAIVRTSALQRRNISRLLVSFESVLNARHATN